MCEYILNYLSLFFLFTDDRITELMHFVIFIIIYDDACILVCHLIVCPVIWWFFKHI